MRLVRHELHTLTGCYALDAVGGAERETFERHLRRCQSCDAEVQGLRETATRLAMATALQPPVEMREIVLSAARRTRQLPPTVEEYLRPARRQGWLPRLSLAVAAVSLAAVAALGVTDAITEHQLDQAHAREQAVAAVLTAPDARIAAQPTSRGGTVTAVVDARRHEMVVIAAGLPALPSAKVYELWLMRAGGARPAGLLHIAAAGRTSPVLASSVTTGDKLGITVEPAGGTSHPTTSPILAMRLPS